MQTIFVLIVMWEGMGFAGDAGRAALAVEFNSAVSCQAAAAAIQSKHRAAVAVCVQK